jgi:hypothetical protein
LTQKPLLSGLNAKFHFSDGRFDTIQICLAMRDEPRGFLNHLENWSSTGLGSMATLSRVKTSTIVNARKRLPVVEVIRKASIREILFPETWVMIPCSVLLENQDCAMGTCVYSAP